MLYRLWWKHHNSRAGAQGRHIPVTAGLVQSLLGQAGGHAGYHGRTDPLGVSVEERAEKWPTKEAKTIVETRPTGNLIRFATETATAPSP